jgi:hypothetical protein
VTSYHRRWVRALAIVVVSAACGRDHFDPAHNIAFVTSTVHDPLTFGTDGAGADAICAQTATAAGLAGDYRAYVATTTIPATDHLGNARGWIRLDGKPVADLVTDLQAGHILYSLRVDENGEDLGPGTLLVATGADLDGRSSIMGNCGDWTNVSFAYTGGSPSGSGPDWAAATTALCTTHAHLYCFGVGLSSPLEVTPPAGRLAFVTVQSFASTGGLAAADALCASEATAAQLPGTFKALLGTTAASAISRFGLSGPTWVRPDGIALADSPLAFAAGDLTAAPSLTAIGTVVTGGRAITGGDLGSPLANDCQGWTVAGGGTTEGAAWRATDEAFNVTSTACGSAPIYCLAQ